eukprot:9691701-Alexandrium_andersonii.AAC.1
MEPVAVGLQLGPGNVAVDPLQDLRVGLALLEESVREVPLGSLRAARLRSTLEARHGQEAAVPEEQVLVPERDEPAIGQQVVGGHVAVGSAPKDRLQGNHGIKPRPVVRVDVDVRLLI